MTPPRRGESSRTTERRTASGPKERDAGGASIGWIDALLAPAGQALLAELAADEVGPRTELALITRLRARYDPALVAIALAQVKLRARARAKFANADRMYFTAPGLEQASSERMARHHGRRFAAYDDVFDLCSGIGGDLIGLAEGGRRVTAVDRDPVHSRLGAINAEANGVGEEVSAVCADVRDLPLAMAAPVFIDPARRTEQRRLHGGASEPPLEWCIGLASGGRAVGIKAAPGLPTELVPTGWELEFVSEHRELKEAALWSPALATVARRATVLPGGETMAAAGGASATRSEIGAPGSFLLDPDPAVTRAGLVEALGAELGAWKIDEQVAFLSSNAVPATAFGRALAIEASMPWSLNRLKEALRSLDVGVVDIRKRGSAVDVDALQRRLKLTGSRAATVVLTRVADRPWVMVCTPA